MEGTGQNRRTERDGHSHPPIARRHDDPIPHGWWVNLGIVRSYPGTPARFCTVLYDHHYCSIFSLQWRSNLWWSDSAKTILSSENWCSWTRGGEGGRKDEDLDGAGAEGGMGYAIHRRRRLDLKISRRTIENDNKSWWKGLRPSD